MTPLLWRSSLRYLVRHPWQIGLSILGIALGVAVVVSIDLANESARRAFALSTESIAGAATHQIVGGPSGVPEALYRTLRIDLGLRSAAPVVQEYVTVYPPHPQNEPVGAAGAGRVLMLLGVDPLAETPFRGYLGSGEGSHLTVLLTRPASVVLAAEMAGRMGLRPGDSFTLTARGVPHPVQLLGVLQAQDERTRHGLEGLLIADIATAQELLGMVGYLSHIDLAFPQGEAGERELARLRTVLPPGAEVVAASTRSQAIGGMTRAFHQNLSALSLLALVVGMFLIYNTLTFAVVQRRALIGSLRSLGVTRGEVFGLVLGEALLVGAIGTVAGVLLGVLLAHALLDLVTRTINDLYFVLTVRDLAITPQVLLKGVALGLGGSLLAGIAPAHEATTAPPRVVLSRSTLELRLRHGAPRMALAGLVLLSVSAALLLLSGTSLLISYLALLAIILGFALLIPILTVGLMWGLQPALGRLFGILGSLAARGVVASLSRTAVAIAALAVAVSATIGLGIMIGSFRDTVVHWLEHTLRADLYVSPRDEASTDGGLAPALVQRLASVPGIASCSTSRVVQIESASGLTHIVALNIGPVAYPAFRFKQGDVRAIWPAFQQGGAVIVSESYAYRHGLRVGSRVRLRTDRGVHAFPVAGVYYAYGTDQGVVTMSRKTYDRFWDDRGISAMGVYAAPGTDIAALKHSLLRIAAAWPGVQVRSNRAILELSLDIFDRTFAVTEVLRLLAGLVAFLGVLSALMALQLERTRELGVLRALGLTPSQLRALVDSQTGLMGLVAGLLALPLGMVMALVLIRVINRHSFGWTLEIHLSPEVLVQGLLLALVAALLAGVYPAFRMARTSPAEALREE